MKERRAVIILVLLVVVLTLAAIVAVVLNQKSSDDIETTTERRIEVENSYQTQAILATEEESKDNEAVSENSTMGGEEESLRETRFGYMHGMEYDEEEIPRRFGYVVEEDIEEREIPLQEEDFKQLRKGQYFDSGRENAKYPIGIADIVGMFDGQIMHTPRNPGSGIAKVSFYYKIDDNTYIILLFEANLRSRPLDHIEVWDAEGNKLRDIEID